MGRVFLDYEAPLTEVPSFKYLEQIQSSTNNYWPAVDHNLQREQVKWGRMVKILGR